MNITLDISKFDFEIMVFCISINFKLACFQNFTIQYMCDFEVKEFANMWENSSRSEVTTEQNSAKP